MKVISFCVGIGISLYSQAQISWSDAFNDSDLSVNPTWTGDTSYFTHTSNQELQLVDSLPNTRSIQSSSSILIDAHWKGKVVLKFNPSSSNFARVVLAGDSTGNEVYLEIGRSSDKVELFKKISGQSQLLISSNSSYLAQSQNELEWDVSYINHVWELNLKPNGGTWDSIGLAPDTTAFTSEYFKLECNYTKTRADKFFWDDIMVSGFPYLDTVAPTVQSVEWSQRNQLTLTFNEAIANYPTQLMDQNQDLWKVSAVNDFTFDLTSTVPCTYGSYTFQLADFTDEAQNGASSFSILFNAPEHADLVINEILFDPSPPVDYPVEYIEILNVSGRTIKLQDAKLLINQSANTISDIILQPNERVVLSSDSSAFPPPVHVVQVSSLSLPNSTATLELLDQWGYSIYRLTYSNTWHTSPLHSNGGWSIERDETAPHCSRRNAWGSSTSTKGGTPGTANQPELISPFAPNTITSVIYADTLTIIRLSEPATKLQASTLDIDSLHIYPMNSENLEWGISSITYERIRITGTLCNGLALDSSGIYAGTIYNFDETAKGKVLITEILTDPSDINGEYLELTNLSDSAFLLSQIHFSAWDLSSGLKELIPFSYEPIILAPKEVLLVTELPAEVFSFYPKKNMRSYCISATLPSLPNEGGLAITTPNGSIVDAVAWSENDHHPALSNTNDVSLYRYSTTIGAGCLKSSPSSVRHGTPGIFEQPQYGTATDIRAVTYRISPNNDGFEDELIILLSDDWQGAIMSMNILNISGATLATPYSNYLVSGGDQLQWNGTNSSGQILPVGQYLIEIKLTKNGSSTEVWRHGFLLSGHL